MKADQKIIVEKYAVMACLKDACKYWVESTYIIIHDDTSYKCGSLWYILGFLCKDCSKQPKWCGKLKVDLKMMW
jgi:hypothetical protein